MYMFEDIFQRKKVVSEALIEYGFKLQNSMYVFSTDIMEGEFNLTIALNESGNIINTKLVDQDSREEYTFYRTNAQGAFVGEVRMAISEVLEDIANNCFTPSVFKQEQTLHLIEYVLSKYGDSPEFLWPSTPSNGIWRRKDTSKWYGAILTVPKDRLGYNSNEIVEILDLRARPESMEDILKQEGFYPGWHMNKKHWFTLILNGSISNEKLYKLIEESYFLAVK